MAQPKSGFDRKARRFPLNLGRPLPAILLLLMLPHLAACDSLLDAAGLERKATVQTETVAKPKSKPPVSPRPQRQQVDIADIQSKLNMLGYDAGPEDGIAGPRTKAAVGKFKTDNGLPADSLITRQFSSALQNASEKANEQAEEEEPGLPTDPIAIDETDEAAGTVVSSTAAPLTAWQEIYDVREQPYYEPGDNYIYSNGRIETAVRVNGETVHWVVNDGSRFTAERNFLLPPVAWKSRLGEVESQVESSSHIKWPPAVATPVVFSAKPSQADASPYLHETWSGEWRCDSEPHSKMAVPAGNFDVAKITCERAAETDDEWPLRFWYYAPDIRHYIRYEETAHAMASPAVSELIAIRPGRSNWTRSARSGFKWAIQKLLDGGQIGDQIEWKIAQSSIEFDIAVTGELTAADNIDCRRYVVVRKKPGSPRLFPALACRDNISGRWKIPGLEKGSILPEDVLAAR
jgi:peptidoglycan hydrolase-like protein with peptidoglycan-binding domain